MGIRKHQRRIARLRMGRAGLKQVNKLAIDMYGKVIGPSYFSRYWRKWVELEEKKNG